MEWDKDLEPAAIEVRTWIKHVYGHLKNTKNFIQLPEKIALQRLAANTKIRRFLTKKSFTKGLLPDHEDTCFWMAYKTGSLIKGRFGILYC